MMKPTPNQIKTTKRVISFALGSFILGLGAGNIAGMDWVQSGLFGATMGVLGVVAAFAFGYARDGELTKSEVDAIMKEAVDKAAQKKKSE
jgi:hypothetical protein